jgi:hypothetical protein
VGALAAVVAESLMPSSYTVSAALALAVIFILMAGLLLFVAHGDE